ncbi:hypothetical protein I8J29_15595 [Paenibacillus sp. MWE-103]|uniref:Butirosin biosynthesis protein H-like n=1 Tax=Paenibacillus artemisiicola TaxID=1172618 RepID=A0ABS3WBE9_9BACL|nr:hypothetical protein [Paenibacillus artemisiicola]MBO7745634.1 hypothetical protein [Paenibacillus artemisiicola]
MNHMELTGLRMTRDSLSYSDAMHAVVTHRGWFRDTKAMLAGMTVNGFRFSAARSLSADSWHAYNWVAEHFLAADFIGIAASSNAGFRFAPTFPLYREHAVAMIKRSLLRGTGAVFWKDDFVVAAGYDDRDGTLLYDDGSVAGGELKRLPYAEFGSNATPYWYCQILEARLEADELSIYKESFMQAIYKWETHDPLLPEDGYACGKRLYEVIVRRLEDGPYDADGLASLLRRYAAAKRDLDAYAARLALVWPECEPIAACYAVVAAAFVRLAAGIRPGGEPDAIVLLREAAEAEEEAVTRMKAHMSERLRNRFNDIALR